MTAPVSNHLHGRFVTRRSVFVGAAASLICAPAVVRATSLMPVRRLALPTVRPWAGFCERLFYNSLDRGLSAGRIDPVLYGRMISKAEARRLVVYAQANGWLWSQRDSLAKA